MNTVTETRFIASAVHTGRNRIRAAAALIEVSGIAKVVYVDFHGSSMEVLNIEKGLFNGFSTVWLVRRAPVALRPDQLAQIERFTMSL